MVKSSHTPQFQQNPEGIYISYSLCSRTKTISGTVGLPELPQHLENMTWHIDETLESICTNRYTSAIDVIIFLRHSLWLCVKNYTPLITFLYHHAVCF